MDFRHGRLCHDERHNGARDFNQRRRHAHRARLLRGIRSASVRALESEVSADVFNIGTGTEARPAELVATLITAMNADVTVRYAPLRKVNPGARCRADTHR